MLKLDTIVGLVALVAIAATTNSAPRAMSASTSGNAGPACRPVDGVASEFRLYAIDVIAGTDTSFATTRTAWSVPSVSESEIYFVADSAICERAARAHAIEARQDTVLPAPVTVLRVGPTRYIVFNGAKSGEFLTYFVFDSLFHYLTSIIS